MTVEYDGLEFERLGHASVRLETDDGTVLYVDPWSDHIEGEPNDADVVLVTHEDFDHYDPDGIEAVAAGDATVAVFEDIDTSDLETDAVALPHEGETTVGGVDVETMPAYNEPDGDHVDDEGDPFHAEGDGVGLLLTLEETTVFLPSDSDFLEHHGAVDADVVVPPIGGHFTMDRHEATDLARAVEPALVLPIHYDTFEPIETDAEAFAANLEEDGVQVELF